MNITGANQYTADKSIPYDTNRHAGKTATIVGREYHISPSTVNKYLQYSKAVDLLRIKYPVFINEVLYEIIKISIDNVIALAKKQDDEANIIINNILQNKKVVESDKLPKRESGKKQNKRTVLPDITQCSVKDMPAFDPDSYVSSLILTIPSWISSIERTADNSNIETISLKAKYDLADSLEKLISISSIIKNILEEE